MTTEPVITVSEAVTAKEVALRNVLTGYAVPDPNIVGTLPKGGRQLSFVGHAEITRILIEVDPMWWWEPAAWDGGVPAITIVNGNAHMAGTLYIHGVGRTDVGSVIESKGDLYKELVSDFLRRAAMRFGIALKLWSQNEWDELKASASENWVEQPKPASKPSKPAPQVDDKTLLTEEQITKFTSYCTQRGLNPVAVYKQAGVTFGKATVGDMAALKKATEELLNGEK